MSKVVPLTFLPAIVMGYLALFTFGLYDNLRGPFYLDITDSLTMSDSVASLFFVITSGVAFFLGVLSARIFCYLGLLQALRLSLAIMGLGFVVMSYAQYSGILFLGSAIFGIGYGLTNVAQNLVVIKGSAPANRRQLLSGLHGVYALAALVAPILAEQFFRLNWSWQSSFRYVSVLSLLGVGFSYFIRWPEDYVIRNQKSKNQIGFFDSFKKLKSEGFLVVASMLAFYVLAEIIVATRLSLLLRRAYFYSPEQAARALTCFFIFLLMGRVLFLVRNFRQNNAQIIQMCLFITIVLFVLGSTLNPLFLVATGLSMGPVFGLAVDYVAERYPSNANEAVSLAVTASGVLLMPAHYLVGFVTELYGARLAVSLGVLPLIVSLVCIYKLNSLKGKVCVPS